MVLPSLNLAILGTSLSTGRLSSDWVPRLAADLLNQPESVGNVNVYNMGKGSQTSTWGVTRAAEVSALRPTHVLMEGFGINDCVDSGGGPAVSRATHITNIQAMVAALLANNPTCDITIQTMNPVGTAGVALRPTLADYYADEIATGTTLGIRTLDHYAGWANPLPVYLSNNLDSLHPIFLNAVDTYLYPAVLFWARQRMAEFWGLSAPVAPTPPAAPDCDYLIIGGGGGGGDSVGGGGGCGELIRQKGLISQLLGPVIIGAAGAAGSASGAGANGGDTSLNGITAKGGGGGGGYSNGSSSLGKNGASGGGGGPFTARHAGGINTSLDGHEGGASASGANDGGGGGGGRIEAGAVGTTNGGQGGAGWTTDVPGDILDVCAGGPGGSFNGSRPAYLPGAGPTAPGGGGKGGGDVGTGAGDAGGPGMVWVWYPGSPRATGGVISSSGGNTVHKFATNGTLA